MNGTDSTRISRSWGCAFDGQEVWVVFEPKVAESVVHPALVRETRRLFESAGDDIWIDDEVFIARPLTLAAAHRLARRVVRILRSDPNG